MRTLAIIPAFNEQDCILGTVANLVATCPEIDYVVINDGSTDETGRLLDENGINHVDLPVNSRLTAAFQTGMKFASRNGYDAAVQFDADGQHLPEYIPRMAATLESEGANIVIASRFLEGKRGKSAREVGSALISFLIKLVSRVTITDPTSGMRMYDRTMIEDFAKGFDLAPEPDMLAYVARKGGKIVEIPAEMQERQGGQSYFDLAHIIRYMMRTCSSIVLFQFFR